MHRKITDACHPFVLHKSSKVRIAVVDIFKVSLVARSNKVWIAFITNNIIYIIFVADIVSDIIVGYADINAILRISAKWTCHPND